MVIQRFRPQFSGQGIQMERLCQALGRRGIQSVVLTATRGRRSEWEGCDGYRIRRLRADLIPGSRTLSHLWMPTFGLRVLVELLRLTRVDVVHVHGLNDGFYGAHAFCRLRRVPLVFEMTLMGVDDPSSVLATRQLFAGARHRAYQDCDAYVAMSRAFLPAYSAAGMPADRLHVIPQGVETDRFRPLAADDRMRVRSELGFAPTDEVVIFAGSLIERKGIDVLLAAWAQVYDRRPGARLLLVGYDDFAEGSDERRFLDTHLSMLPAAARGAIRRTGVRSDVERLLGAADVFAFPSRREGFGSVIIEAMACGLPCVVARMDGITDLVFAAPVRAHEAAARTGDGIVVPQDDPQALSGSLLALLGDRARAADMAAAGLQRARTQFDFDRTIAPTYQQLYSTVIARRREGE